MVTAVVLSAPFAAQARDEMFYVTGKLGTYVPTGDLDDKDFDTGAGAEAAFGLRLSPVFALEESSGFLSPKPMATFAKKTNCWLPPRR